jgi:hypothetical protein
MKLKRKVVYEKHLEVIEAMYVEHPPAAHGHTNPKAKL